MKHIFPFIFLAVFVFTSCAGNKPASTLGSSSAHGVTVVRLWPEYRTAESFDRISEYFTDKENIGGQIILRTQPDQRAGFYFFTRLKNPADINGARIELSVITPASAGAKTFTLAAPLIPKGNIVLNPGLTGDDWPDASAHPVAWRIRLLAADGAEIFAQQSYLWN